LLFLQEIEQRLITEGFLFICRCQTRLSRQQAEHFYSVHKGSEDVILDIMSETSCFQNVLRYRNLIKYRN